MNTNKVFLCIGEYTIFKFSILFQSIIIKISYITSSTIPFPCIDIFPVPRLGTAKREHLLWRTRYVIHILCYAIGLIWMMNSSFTFVRVPHLLNLQAVIALSFPSFYTNPSHDMALWTLRRCQHFFNGQPEIQLAELSVSHR